ncbi:ComEA family DNA-binding protein [Enterococcus sp. LJL128]
MLTELILNVRKNSLKKILLWQTLIVILGSLFVLPTRGSAEALDKVDINYANQVDLELITGIGPVISERIVQGRPYESLDDLLKVKGIGTKTLEKIKAQNVAFVIKDSETKTYREWFPNNIHLARGAANMNLSLSYDDDDELDEEVTYEELRKKTGITVNSEAFKQNKECFYMLQGLRYLEIIDGFKMDGNVDFSPLKNLKQIDGLRFQFIELQSEKLCDLFKYTENVDSISVWCAGGSSDKGSFLQNLYKFKKLKYLSFFWTDIQSLEFVSKIERLETLAYNEPCRQGSAEIFYPVNDLPYFKKLIIDNNFNNYSAVEMSRIYREINAKIEMGDYHYW